jgi:hypothetical protein
VAGEVLKRNAGNDGWECVADSDTPTTYTAGSGVSVVGTQISAASEKNTVTVSPENGDYTGLKAAVDAAGTWCTGATAENRCLIRLMPGTYALDAQLSISAFFDIVGQGAENTVISRTSGSGSSATSGVLQMYNDTSLRAVTIKNTGVGTAYATGVYIRAPSSLTTGKVKLAEVTVDVSGATANNYGVRAYYLLKVSIADSTISAHLGSAASCNYSYGVNGTNQTAGASLDIKRSSITVSGCASGNRGVQPERDTTMTDVTVSASGTNAQGIRSYLDPLIVNRCNITSSEVAIYVYTGAVDIRASTLSGTVLLNASQPSASATCYRSESASGKTLAADCAETLSTTDVPIGAVLDWYRPDTTTLVPAGFQICDGSVIADVRSPWNGKNVPNLSQKFVRGEVQYTNIGTTGGSDSHTHTTPIDHEHPAKTSGSGGASHSHNYSKTHDHLSVTTSSKGSAHTHSTTIPLSALETQTTFDTHNHAWSRFSSAEDWASYASNGDVLSIGNWDNGMDGDGAGNYPISRTANTGTSNVYYYTNNDSHNHQVPFVHQHPAATSGNGSASHTHTANVANYSSPTNTSGSKTASHTHSVDPAALTANAASTSTSNVPAYYGLLKIMRIY